MIIKHTHKKPETKSVRMSSLPSGVYTGLISNNKAIVIVVESIKGNAVGLYKYENKPMQPWYQADVSGATHIDNPVPVDIMQIDVEAI